MHRQNKIESIQSRLGCFVFLQIVNYNSTLEIRDVDLQGMFIDLALGGPRNRLQLWNLDYFNRLSFFDPSVRYGRFYGVTARSNSALTSTLLDNFVPCCYNQKLFMNNYNY